MKYIKNGRIVMPDRIIDGKTLAYDGQISGYINAGDIPEGAEVIDAQGNYVCPGFVDIHFTDISTKTRPTEIPRESVRWHTALPKTELRHFFPRQ